MQKQEKAHAKFSASSSDRWLACPGSMELSKDIPPSPDTAYSIEGTRAHECLEYFLVNREKAFKDSKAFKTFEHYLSGKGYDDEMIQHAGDAAKLILEMIPEGADFFAETKSSLAYIDEEASGTADAVIADIFGKLIVVDFKYGAGIPVDPEENTQMIFYALGIAHKYNYDFSEVELVIIQPRAFHENGPIRSWRLSMPELIKWEGIFERGIKAARDPFAPLKAGEKHCRFCPAKAICPEISDKAMASAKIDFAPLSDSKVGAITPVVLPNVTLISERDLPEILDAFPKIETYMDSVRLLAEDMLRRGTKIPGWKLVDKRATRKWANPEEAEEELLQHFGENIYTTPQLESPAQIEKKIPSAKKLVATLTTAVSSGSTMVRDSDSRPAINSVLEDFGPVQIEFDFKKPGPLEGLIAGPKKKSTAQNIKNKFARQHRAGVVKTASISKHTKRK